MKKAQLDTLRKLNSIGGWVSEGEIAYHLGKRSVIELFEAEAEGLVVSRTEFTPTDEGEAKLGEPT